MDILIRKHFYDKSLWHWCPSSENWLRLIKKPFVCVNKEEAPLGIYGTLVDNPAINPLTLQPQYIGANIASLYFLQLDYDSSISIDEWVADNKNLSYVLYTSHSHGYKGDHDRFRVILPLDKPLDCDMLDYYFKKAMINEFGCDPSCFDRGHCQLVPVIRDANSPYRWAYNKGTKYSIDWSKVEAERERGHNEIDFQHAAAMFNKKYGNPVTEKEEEERMLRWAEKALGEMHEGERNRTSFEILTYLKRHGLDFMCVDRLAQSVEADFIDEFMRMAARLL